MKKISILTATRAEYGLLKPVIERFKNDKLFKTEIVVTGAHLSSEFGLTYKEIEEDGFQIDEKIEILLSSDSPSGISKSMGLAMISFADYFASSKPDLLVVLGDRYETLAVVTVAMNQQIPIAHIYGGETTEGAIDEAIRHSITKFSHIHFTSTEDYRKRVIQLGESPDRVFNVGGLGVENIMNEKLLTKDDLMDNLGINKDMPYALVTFHPVTLESDSSEEQIINLLEVCKDYKDMNFIITKANADANGRIINQYIDKYAERYENIKSFTSLGLKRYLSAMKYSEVVIGNSSSGILEAPGFKVPTVNIGDRQKGRIQAENILNAEPTKESIKKTVDEACSTEFRNSIRNMTNPYGNGEASELIFNTIKDFLIEEKLNLKKVFFDIEVEK